MDIIYQKLFEIKRRPELYLRRKSLYNLALYISGYRQRQLETDPEFRTSFDDFSSFVNDYYGYGCESLDWERILYFVIGDDKKAFDVFYELLEIYYKENG